MTRGITDMLGLPPLDEVLKQHGIDPNEEPEEDFTPEEDDALAEMTALVSNPDTKLKIAEAEDHSKAMDVIHKETLDHSRSLMDLAYNVDERSRRGIFEIGVAMYKNAIDAKNSKRDAQLKLMKLIQDQQKLDLDERRFKIENGQAEVNSDVAFVADRNSLIQQVLDEQKKTKEVKKS
jgi:hypothetical protein